MKFTNKIVFLIILVLLIFTVNRSYASNSNYDIKFDLEKDIYTKSVTSQYKEIKINNIAPGVEGNINIIIQNINNNSDTYYLEFMEEENKPKNMRFYYKGNEYNSLLELNKFINKEIKENKEEKKDNEIEIIKIKYLWKYETGNNSYEIEKNDEIDKEDNNKVYRFKILLKEEYYNKTNGIGLAVNPKTGDNIYICVLFFIISIIGTYITYKRNKKVENIEQKN